jgi:hypothetical protein
MWWNEDLVIWSFHFHSFSTYLTVSVNPLGGYRVESTRAGQTSSLCRFGFHWFDSWSAEATIPIGTCELLSVSVERIRAPRPVLRNFAGIGPVL